MKYLNVAISKRCFYEVVSMATQRILLTAHDSRHSLLSELQQAPNSALIPLLLGNGRIINEVQVVGLPHGHRAALVTHRIRRSPTENLPCIRVLDPDFN
jgi:hypothetical protein